MFYIFITLLITIISYKFIFFKRDNHINYKINLSYAFLKKILLENMDKYDNLILNTFIKDKKLGFNTKLKYYLSIPNNDFDNYKLELTDNLKKLTKRTIKYIAKVNNMCPEKLYLYFEKNSPEYFSKYKSFNIFGDNISRDIDILLSVENAKNPLLSSEYTRLVNDLKGLDYNIKKNIDYNLIMLKDGLIQDLQKGGTETQNILYYTYHLHKQKYEMMINRTVVEKIHYKAMSINKFILNYLQYFVKDYHKIRIQKSNAYKDGGIKLVKFTTSIWDKFVLDTSFNDKSKDVWKSLTVKYIQLLALYTGVYDKLSETHKIFYYTKYGMIRITFLIIDALELNIANYDLIHIENLLFRKECNNFDLVKIFHQKFSEIIVETYPKFSNNLNTMLLNQFDINTLPIPELQELYFKNPICLIPEFCKLWAKSYNTNLHEPFISPSDNINLIRKYFPNIYKRIHIESQGTHLWKELLNFYNCGSNTGIVSLSPDLEDWEIIQKRSNLIMGLIGEGFCLNHLNYNNYQLVRLGLLVKEKNKKNSDGCAPDGLLINSVTKEIIPVEIKTISSKPNDGNIFKREFFLATKQLRTATEILNYNNNIISRKGMLIILWIYQKNNKWVYQMDTDIIDTLNNKHWY
jgi:hypothetical protein